MEESDRTMALKKAYAEIILNTAKEAAARVMVSERKVVRFHQDLSSTKDEALRLLVRLKQMIDAKTIEAEITSSNQQRRIDELEAQLQEAEDIITDLRSELEWVRDKLQKAKSTQLQPLNVTNTKEEAISCQIPNEEVVDIITPKSALININASQLRDPLLNNKCGNEMKNSNEMSLSCDSDLDINAGNNENELYRNEDIQGSCATERNLPNGKLSPSGDGNDQWALGKNGEEGLRSGNIDGTKIGVKDKARHIVLALKARNVEMMEKPSMEEMRRPSRALRRRRKRRWGKAKANLRKSRVVRLMKPCQSSSLLSCSKTSTTNGNDEDFSHTHPPGKAEKIDAEKSDKGLVEHLQKKSGLYSDEIAIIRKGKKQRNMKSLDSIISSFKPPEQQAKSCQECNLVSANAEGGEEKLKESENGVTVKPPEHLAKLFQSNLVPVNVNYGEDMPKKVPANDAKIKPLSRLNPGLTLIRSNLDPTSGSTDLTVSVKALGRSRNEALLLKQENIVVSELSSEMVNIPLVGASEEVNESPSKVDGNRTLKYTFQRKRKKGPVSDNDENNSPVKQKTDGKENDTQDAQNSFVVNESSGGTQRLAQVAN